MKGVSRTAKQSVGATDGRRAVRSHLQVWQESTDREGLICEAAAA